MSEARTWIEALDLMPHPEGGFYRESYRAGACFEGEDTAFPTGRSHATAIYFLLQGGNFSSFHRIRSDELWHFHTGDGLHIHVIEPAGGYRRLQLGTDVAAGHLPQAVVPAGSWFASEVVPGGSFSLVGCTVAPGFDFADFELADGIELSTRYAHHAELVRRLTRSGREDSGTS